MAAGIRRTGIAVVAALATATVAATAAEAPRRLAAGEDRGNPPLRALDAVRHQPGAVAGPASTTEGPGRRHRLLLNVADAPISGWHFACVYGLADGRSAWTGEGGDAFPGRRDAEAPAEDDSLLQPGESLVVTLPEAPERKSPFDVWACGPTAAVFADGSTWGSPRILDRLFARRLSDTREAIRLLRALEGVEEASAARRLTTAEMASTLEAALAEEGWGRYRGEVAAATRPATPRRTSEELERLEANVRQDLARMLAQLRPEDLAQLTPDGGGAR